jgi:hypothetical protein
MCDYVMFRLFFTGYLTAYCVYRLRRGADKSLAFRISSFLICSTTKRIFLGWVKEVRTTKSFVCGAQGGIYWVIFF